MQRFFLPFYYYLLLLLLLFLETRPNTVCHLSASIRKRVDSATLEAVCSQALPLRGMKGRHFPASAHLL